LILELSGHACPEPLLAKLNLDLEMSIFSRPNLIIPSALHSLDARCLPLGIGLSRESCYFGCLVPVSRDGTFSRVLLFLHFWVGINPRASLNENIFTDFNKVAKDLFFIFYFLNKINLY
jgi:hypothetical protein